jgi:hypothetical protein
VVVATKNKGNIIHPKRNGMVKIDCEILNFEFTDKTIGENPLKY